MQWNYALGTNHFKAEQARLCKSLLENTSTVSIMMQAITEKGSKLIEESVKIAIVGSSVCYKGSYSCMKGQIHVLLYKACLPATSG